MDNIRTLVPQQQFDNQQLDLIELYSGMFTISPSGCWLWCGASVRGIYGKLGIAGKTIPAHRFFYEQLVGPIPEGYQIDHLCRVTLCVNPDHLEAVTPRENTLRSTSKSAINARKTHCSKGHPFTDENTYLWVGKSGHSMRHCRICREETDQRRQQKRKKTNMPKARLTLEQVQQIRQMLASGMSTVDIADTLHIGQSSVSRIRNGKHFTEEV